MNAEIVNQVIERVKLAYDYVFAKREKISREAGMADVRVARESALHHPHLSSTPLPEALERANNVFNKLQREAGPLVEKATIHLLAVEQASREVEAVKTAIKTKHHSDMSKAAVGLYQAAVRVVDKLGDFGAKRWVLLQQSASEIRIYADLMRWKARNPDLDDPNSPWLCLLACYAGREMDVERDAGERYGTSMPQHVADAMRAKRKQTGLQTFELPTGPVAYDEPPGVADEDPENAEPPPSVLPPSLPDIPTTPPALPVVAIADSADAVGGAGGAGVTTGMQDPNPEDFYPVAREIASKDGTSQAIWDAVGFPTGSKDYRAILLNGEAAIASGSPVPHLPEFLEAAGAGYPAVFLHELQEERARRLAERLAVNPEERAKARAAGYNLPEN